MLWICLCVGVVVLFPRTYLGRKVFNIPILRQLAYFIVSKLVNKVHNMVLYSRIIKLYGWASMC